MTKGMAEFLPCLFLAVERRFCYDKDIMTAMDIGLIFRKKGNDGI